MPKLIAVLTGDVIASRKTADPKRLSAALDVALARVCDRFAGEAERYRGDAFQLALLDAEHAMTAAVMLRAALIERSEARQRWDARIAVAVGQDGWRPGQRIAEASGELFVRSGKALDAMDNGAGHLHLERLAERDEPDAGLVLLTRFADDLIDGWSRYSAEAVGLLLRHGESQQALAERLGISQPAVHKRLRTARWALLDAYLRHTRRQLTDEASRS